MKKRLVIVGAKGPGQIAMSVFEAVNEKTQEWEIAGYLNDIVNVGEYLDRHKVVGTSDEIMNFVNNGYHIHYTFHFNAKNKSERVKKFKSYNIPLEANATAVHPKAVIDPDTELGNGIVITPNVYTSSCPKIGNFIHMYGGAFIGHDSIINDYATIAARSVIGARVNVNEGAHIGLNSSIREEITIGKYSIVGMGAVVVKDVPDYSVVVGNPAKIITKR